jgi:hypothetical protein
MRSFSDTRLERLFDDEVAALRSSFSFAVLSSLAAKFCKGFLKA